MDTYEFVQQWHARIPDDWEMEADGQEVAQREAFIAVKGLDVVFAPGVKCRGIPEPHLQRMIDQGLVKKSEATGGSAAAEAAPKSETEPKSEV